MFPELWPLLSELKEILTAVIDGNFSFLSSEGSLAGSSGAEQVGGSVVGSVISGLGLEDLIGQIPVTSSEALGSIG